MDRSRLRRSRLAQVERDAWTSPGVARRQAVTSKPRPLHAATTTSGSIATRPERRSRSAAETSRRSVPLGLTSAASREAIRSSSPTTPRSSDPHGKWTVTRSAMASSPAGRASAAATTKMAFGRPPPYGGLPARREASTMPAALASMPITSSSGRSAARARTNRPSPVPTSSVTAAYDAAASVSQPTSTSERRRPSRTCIGP